MRMGALYVSILLVYCLCAVTLVRVTHGDACATTDERMAPLYQQIDADMSYWRNFLNGSQLTRNELRLLVSRNLFPYGEHQEGQRSMQTVIYNAVLIKDNKWYFPLREFGYDLNCSAQGSSDLWLDWTHQHKEWCSPRMRTLQAAFYRWVASGVNFPDVFFVADLENGGGCRFNTQCPAPVLALYKVLQKDEYKRDGAQVLVKNGQGSILIPHMSSGAHNQAESLAGQQLATVPWAQKRRKAVFHGLAQCPQFHRNRFTHCSREYFRDLGKTVTDKLDISTTDPNEFDRRMGVDPLRLTPTELAQYAYVLALDGASGSRLADYLRVNSLILKESSPVVQHFTAALAPGVHYKPILVNNANDVFDVMAATTDEEAQRIADNAQAFAQRYLCDSAHLLYFRKVVAEYRSLFAPGEMEAWISNDMWPVLAARMRLGFSNMT